jgi:hypothetical protein
MRVAYLSPLRNSASLVPPLVSAQYNGRVGVKQDGARGRKVFGVNCVTLSLPRRGCLIMLNCPRTCFKSLSLVPQLRQPLQESSALCDDRSYCVNGPSIEGTTRVKTSLHKGVGRACSLFH